MIQISINNKRYECTSIIETHSNNPKESVVVLHNPSNELDNYLRQKMNTTDGINMENWSFGGEYELVRMEIDECGDTLFVLDATVFIIKDEDDDW